MKKIKETSPHTFHTYYNRIFRIQQSRMHKSDMENFFLCNGDEIQGIVKPTGAHDTRFQRFIGMICTRKFGISDLCTHKVEISSQEVMK